jgi:transcriptional regulator with XRE-family HTH domain
MDKLQLGQNIRNRRKKFKLTLIEVSKRTGVSQSFLSQIEQSKVSPSLQTLNKIAAALQTTITSLLQTNSSKGKDILIKQKDRQVIDDDSKKLTIELLSKSNNDRMMQTFLFTFHGKSSTQASKYQHFGQEFIFMLEGKIKVVLDSVEYIIEKGDTLYYNSGQVHTIENYIDGTSKFIGVNTPPSF